MTCCFLAPSLSPNNRSISLNFKHHHQPLVDALGYGAHRQRALEARQHRARLCDILAVRPRTLFPSRFHPRPKKARGLIVGSYRLIPLSALHRRRAFSLPAGVDAPSRREHVALTRRWTLVRFARWGPGGCGRPTKRIHDSQKAASAIFLRVASA